MKTKIRSIMSARSGYSGGKTLNNNVSRRLFALGLSGILLISVCALLPSPAQAQCKRWDVSGQWELRLDNGVSVKVNLQQGEWAQTSANLTGTGTFKLSADDATHAGVISGNITENSFAMAITVDTEALRFTGTVGSSGKIEGTAKRGIRWVSSRRMKCADEVDKSSSSDTDDQHGKKKKKNKKHHRHHDDEQNQGNDHN